MDPVARGQGRRVGQPAVRYPDDHADEAERWVLTLTTKDAKRKAGMLSKNFWLLT